MEEAFKQDPKARKHCWRDEECPGVKCDLIAHECLIPVESQIDNFLMVI
jgi:hypothetical protein